MMASDQTVAPGFATPGFASQQVFRDVMTAMAKPAAPVRCAQWPPSGSPGRLLPSAAAVVLTLADFETSIYLDDTLSGDPQITGFLDFHTGAPRTSEPAKAQFALIAAPHALGDFTAFAQGTPEYPDRSATLIIQIEAFTRDHCFVGPGIADTVAFGIAPAIPEFATQWAANRARFPCGVDLIFAGPDAIAALPRSSRFVEG